ncbi:DNA mismatch repair endonuclease MutL [Neiella marina]|uniref:DNA mismatch repair protein MutL n=1 Tax=Neiella holothuriorum TaxID=2870530 RepID=A0ABS7EFB7_9GAMM|nr:DNA mismatch repair endonuclease MutL [Neiella holothuriorum]
MTIQILPPRLANQIAAGEVVERPASVVKELVENSLDAGATKIDVQIERGGHKRLLIRDNGSGIDKEQLMLALSRHATSKVHSLDDIESIATLGFRGEALASISSVARLSLTSRPPTQTEAWLAYAEGRDMQVQLKPAAHPVGTSVEVADLFFNTPARRKFLRADKTEFHHIDELIKRLALSRFDVGFSLTHNGKCVRNLPPCATDAAKLKRLQAICGAEFCRHVIHMSQDGGPLKIAGWLLKPAGCGQQSPPQYTFINGRMIRDKVITHAVRQAYAGYVSDVGLTGYVLYLELPFDQVDVNVHPTKHEVRFIETRLVHDFVVQAVAQALSHTQQSIEVDSSFESAASIEPNQTALASDTYVDTSTGEIVTSTSPSKMEQVASANKGANTAAASPRYGAGQPKPHWVAESTPSKQAVRNYQALIAPQRANTEDGHYSQQITANDQVDSAAEACGANTTPHFVAIAPHFALVLHQGQPLMLDVLAAAQRQKQLQQPLPWKAQPLLLPMAVTLEPEQIELWRKCLSYGAKFGIEIALPHPNKLIIRCLPAVLRHTDLAAQLDQLLSELQQQESEEQTASQLIALGLASEVSDMMQTQRLAGLVDYAATDMTANYWREVSADLLTSTFD